MKSHRIRRLIIFFCSAIWLFSGSGALATPQDQEERLTKRVNEYWGYKIKRNFEKSYPYESPEYRQKITLSKYQQSFGPGVEWLSVKVEKVEIKKDLATVRVKIGYRWTMVPVGPKDGFSGTKTENWRMVDGTWYRVKKVKQSSMLKEVEKIKLK